MHPFISTSRHAAQSAGTLSGRTFAIKDLFAVRGEVTGFGNPTWAATHPPASFTAPAVIALLAAGAELVGRVHTDEMAYSLAGINDHFGAVDNPRAPGRTTGGSSSGSAGAVAAGLVDFALGTDTGGSVRVPASYCGLFGMRPTHGAVSLEGACPLAPSFDTAGWFARDIVSLGDVGRVLLPKDSARLAPRKLWLPDDARMRLRPDAQPLLEARARELAAQWKLELVTTPLAESGDDLLEWAEIFRIHQAREAWLEHGEWITTQSPRLGEAVAQRFRMARAITDAEFAAARSGRQQRRERLWHRLADHTLLLLPPAPDIPPALDAPADAIQDARVRTLQLSSIASLCGLPQVAFPWIEREGAPLGLSLAGPAGTDRQLLDWLGRGLSEGI